jgi:hypothetical protein
MAKKLSDFGRAFSEARAAGKSVFDWNGGKYHTRTKEDEAKVAAATPTPRRNPSRPVPDGRTKDDNAASVPQPTKVATPMGPHSRSASQDHAREMAKKRGAASGDQTRATALKGMKNAWQAQNANPNRGPHPQSASQDHAKEMAKKRGAASGDQTRDTPLKKLRRWMIGG